MKIELLYFADCPSWKMGLENLKAALTAEKVDENIELIQVETDEKATTEKFLGSPSFRINGQDLWPEDRSAYHLGCRIYKTDKGMRGVPTIDMLREKIRQFLT